MFPAALQDRHTKVTSAQMHFYGLAERSITIECRFSSSKKWKIFCKEKCEEGNILIETQLNSNQHGRYSTEYRYEYKYILSVSIRSLIKSDSGRYTCGLGRHPSSYQFIHFGIVVAEGEFQLFLEFWIKFSVFLPFVQIFFGIYWLNEILLGPTYSLCFCFFKSRNCRTANLNIGSIWWGKQNKTGDNFRHKGKLTYKIPQEHLTHSWNTQLHLETGTKGYIQSVHTFTDPHTAQHQRSLQSKVRERFLGWCGVWEMRS